MRQSGNDDGSERPNGHEPGAWDEGIEAGEQPELEEIGIFTNGARLLELLRRANEGESPDLLFAEMWANAAHVSRDDE